MYEITIIADYKSRATYQNITISYLDSVIFETGRFSRDLLPRLISLKTRYYFDWSA